MQDYIAVTNSPTGQFLAQDYLTPGPSPVADVIRLGDVIDVSAQPVVQNVAGTLSIYSPDYDPTDTISMAVGNFNTPPTAGIVSLEVGVTTTGLGSIPYNVTAAALRTALNAALTTEAKPNCTVQLIQSGSYQITGSTNGAIPSGLFSVTNFATLYPPSTAVFQEGSLGSTDSPYIVLFIMAQSPAAFAELATELPDPDCAIVPVQAGSGTANKIQSIQFTPGAYGGSATVSATANSVTTSCGTVTPLMTADAVGNVLANHPEIEFNNPDGTPNNIAVTQVGRHWNVEFIDTLGDDDTNELAISTATVVGPIGKSGQINYGTFNILLYAQGQANTGFTLTRQIQRTKTTGEVFTIYSGPVTVKPSLINSLTSVPTPLPDFYTKTETDALLALKANITPTITQISGTYAILAGDQIVQATAGTFTATLPTAVGASPKTIKNSGSGVVTLATTGGQTIDDAATQTLTQYDSLNVFPKDGNWIII